MVAKLHQRCVLSVQKQAIEITSDCPYRRTFHSDRGWAYQMGAYSSVLKEKQNISKYVSEKEIVMITLMENFLNIKAGNVLWNYILQLKSFKDAIERYIKYYNEKRNKEKLGWMSPLSIGSTPWLHKNSVAVVKTTTL